MIKITAIILGFFIFQNSYSQSAIETNLLIGKWKFVKFDWPDNAPETTIKQNNAYFKDAVYNFTSDKQLIIKQPNSPKGFRTKLVYTIKGAKVYVAPPGYKGNQPQILYILLLDKNSLKFSVEGSETIGTFTRTTE